MVRSWVRFGLAAGLVLVLGTAGAGAGEAGHPARPVAPAPGIDRRAGGRALPNGPSQGDHHGGGRCTARHGRTLGGQLRQAIQAARTPVPHRPGAVDGGGPGHCATAPSCGGPFGTGCAAGIYGADRGVAGGTRPCRLVPAR